MYASISLDERDAWAVKRKLDRIEGKAADVSVPLLRFHGDFVAALSVAWSVRATGGRFRGMAWSPMAPQYKRKSGVTIPAWGGVQKARGSGLVKGRLRPSKQRVRQTSVIGQDTGALRAAVVSSDPIVQERTLVIGANLPIYAETVLAATGRNPLVFVREDVVRLRRVVDKWLREVCREWKR